MCRLPSARGVTIDTVSSNWTKLLASLNRVHLFRRTVLDETVFKRFESEKITCKPNPEPYPDLHHAGALAGKLSGRFKEGYEGHREMEVGLGQGSVSGRDDWRTISYRLPLTGMERNEGLQRARKVLLNFDYFPPDLVRVYGQWNIESRLMKVGDRFMQQVNLTPLIPKFLHTLTMDQVVHVYNDSNRVGFTVVTTTLHDEIGEHSAWVRWDETTKVCIFEAVSSSAFDDYVFGPAKWYARRLQHKAHQRAQKYLLQKLCEKNSK